MSSLNIKDFSGNPWQNAINLNVKFANTSGSHITINCCHFFRL